MGTSEKIRQSLKPNYYFFCCLIVTLFLIGQFIGHGKVGDDWPNSQIPNFNYWRYGESNLVTFLMEWEYWYTAWSQGQGRFLWSGQLHSLLFFWLFPSTLSANLVSAFIFLLMIWVWNLFLYLILNKDKRTFFYFPLFILVLTRFRWDFDPHIGFTPLLTTMLFYSGLAALFLLTSLQTKKTMLSMFLSIMSAISAFVALSTYELALFPILSAILIGLIFATSRQDIPRSSLMHQSINFVPIFVAVISYLFIVFAVLRVNASPTGSYSLGFSPTSSVKTFMNHLIATIPLLNSDFSKIFMFPESKLRSLYSVLSFLGVLFSCIWIRKREYTSIKRISHSNSRDPNQSFIDFSKTSKLITLALIIMLIGPSAMIGIQPAYWGRINWGNSYLGIIVQEIALAMIVTVVALKSSSKTFSVKQRDNAKRVIMRRLSQPILNKNRIFMICLLVFLTSISNQRFIETTFARNNISAVWESITIDKWLFSQVKEKDLFFSVTHNDAYEINVADFYKRTGIRLSQMLPPSYVFPEYGNCSNLDACDNIVLDWVAIQKTIGNSARSFKSSFYVGDNTYRSYKQDWPTEITGTDALQDSNIWFFNIYMLTPDTGVAYLAELVPTEDRGLKVKLNSLKLQQVVLGDSNELNVGISNLCLTETDKLRNIQTSFGRARVSNWTPSDKTILLDKNLNAPRSYIDPRAISINICPPR